MQKIATKVFIISSIAFGIIGIVFVIAAPQKDNDNTDFNILIMKLLLATVFVILPSFALSVAGKYLNGKK
jgi:hypothetical membrane protein